MWYWRKRATAIPAGQRVRRVSRAMVEGLERRCLFAVTAVSIDTGDYVPPGPGDSNGPTPGSMVERISGFNGTYTFHTDHDDVDGGLAWVSINYGDFMGPVQPFLQTAGTWSLGHTYDEEGAYNVAVNVQDASGQSTSTGEAWTGTFNSSGVGLSVSDGALAAAGNADLSFDPNSTINQPVAYFADQGVPDLSDYTGTIDWGDGSGPTAATFAMADNGAVAVWGSHTYTYQTDPDTGEVMRPVADYGAQTDYTITAHVIDSGGSSVDITTLASANLGPKIVCSATPGGKAAVLGIAASSKAGTLTFYAKQIDGKDRGLPIAGSLTVTVSKVTGAVGPITWVCPVVAGDTEPITLNWTPNSPAAGSSIQLAVDNPDGSGAHGLVTIRFGP